MAFYAVAASEILEYILRDMTSPEGAFYSSEDADSEGGEGAFYTWTTEEMAAVLSTEQLTLAVNYWNVTGVNSILHQSGDLALSDEEQVEIEVIREALLTARGSRSRPFRDEKILADWNGLMIATLAKASVVLNNPEYLNAAVNSFEFIRENMMDSGERLSHSYAMGRRGPDGFLDDYAFLIWGVLELYNATLDQRYLHYAVDLQRELDIHFADQSAGGYFFTGDYSDLQVETARLKESYDGAVPSGNSVELTNLLMLWKLTGEPGYLEAASGIETAFGALVSSSPRGYSMMLSGIMYGQQGGTEVLLSGGISDQALQEMLKVLRTGYRPWTTLMLADPDDLSQNPPWTPENLDTSTAAYLCRNGACSLPVRTAEDLEDLLKLDL